MRRRLEGILARTDRARAWGDAALPLQSLINRDGFVPIKTRLSVDDLEMLVGVRKELLCFSELGLRLLDLHQPRDAGGITSDAAHPILRCRSCMWRWPCPTFRAMSEALDALSAEEPARGQAPAAGPAGASEGFGAAVPFRAGDVADTNASIDMSGYRFVSGWAGGPVEGTVTGPAPEFRPAGGAPGFPPPGGGAQEFRPAAGVGPEFRSGRGVADRKPDLEAAPRAFVDHGDGAFVRFDDPARDGEPQPRAPIGARGPRGLAAKGHVEDPW